MTAGEGAGPEGVGDHTAGAKGTGPKRTWLQGAAFTGRSLFRLQGPRPCRTPKARATAWRLWEDGTQLPKLGHHFSVT